MNTATRFRAATSTGPTASAASTSSSPRAPTEFAAALDLKGWIVKLTGVLVVVPALINATYDVYAVAVQLPRTDAERTNTELFRKYFNKAPVAAMPVPIRSSAGTVEAKVAIYEEGEIYVEYGQRSQWFAFPKSDPAKKAAASLIPMAHAQPVPAGPAPERAAIASQKETLIGSTLVRSRTYVDGRTEERRIDIRSGATLSVDVGQVAKEDIAAPTRSWRTIKVEPIDLRQATTKQVSK